MMTPRERWLAALCLQPVDRLPFWPKLGSGYPRAQQPPFSTMGLEEIEAWVGSNRHVGLPQGLRESRGGTTVETSTQGNTRRTVFRAPLGAAERIDRFDEISQAWHPIRFPVRSLRDIHIMIQVYEDCEVELDPEALAMGSARARELGEGGSTFTTVGKSPLMYWVEWLAGIEHAHYLLADHAAEVEELFAAMHRVLLRSMQLLAQHSPADMLYLSENTSTTLVSPAQYRRYWLEYIREYGLACQAAGKPLVLHMCGHLKALLPDLAALPAAAFEAFTSPTIGNATLLDGRLACPDKCLIGGTNAALWLQPTTEIIGQLERDLAPLPHHRGLVITPAGVMPPGCRPETIKAVCEWLRGYRARCC